MRIKYICPYWGQEQLSLANFITKVIECGYDGIEINIPEVKTTIAEFHSAMESLSQVQKKDFVFIAQQVLPPAIETPEQYCARMKKRLHFLTGLKPKFINSHTGKDHFSFDENCRIIEAAMNIAAKSGVRILHETHRGRFSFHAGSLLPYLKKFPEMELVGDFSHWCTVSESLLQDQLYILEAIIPYVSHIHARIGYEHSPQVADPFAPEWELHLNIFMAWWEKIIVFRQGKKLNEMTICPEFGPAPYMPVLPFTRQPIGDQWSINSRVKDYLKKHLRHT